MINLLIILGGVIIGSLIVALLIICQEKNGLEKHVEFLRVQRDYIYELQIKMLKSVYYDNRTGRAFTITDDEIDVIGEL